MAQVFEASQRRLMHSVDELRENTQPTRLHIGTLEGLSDIAMESAHRVLQTTSVEFLQLDVLELAEIETQFLSGGIDLAFTSRVPSHRKLEKVIELGKQSFDKYRNHWDYGVFSPFEYAKQNLELSKKTIVSNSLNIRRQWLETHGGVGQVPGAIGKKGELPVLVIANDWVQDSLWNQFQETAKAFQVV